DFPSDGLVLIYDDIEYGKSLGQTAKFPRDAIAFKWRDEIRETKLTEIEWSASRTGLINPVAIFEPVELEGTTVSRASVHNVSIVKELKLGLGDTITVYKANMIIPQIAENLTKSGTLEIPKTCPVCGGPTEIKKDADTEVLICTNPECPAKHVKRFEHFVSRDCMNIDGISEATAERLIAAGVLHEYADLFKLGNHKDIIVNLEGFKDKSLENMMAAAEKASRTTPARLLNALGIEGIGTANAKVIAKAAGNDWAKVESLTRDELLGISGVGDILADSYVAFFASEANKAEVAHLLEVLSFEEVSDEGSDELLAGKTFVITGSLETFGNRKELQELIEKRGGKVAGSVSNKTSYLINNDNMSGSTKNKTAKSLGVPIITEAEFLDMLK
ncbi:MAG: NAD-dependent DNA ligase LigA, partial [Firmicutes bacterium]|nr:NAD-dependent DNA ligase LigA [Bacillota bacterium]